MLLTFGSYIRLLLISVLLVLIQEHVAGQESRLYKLPSGPSGAGSFGAFYTNLSYDPSWDEPWRTADHPDIVVRFEDDAHRFVFWRGTSYIPAWVSENGIWYTNEFVERRDIHNENTTSIVEPMSDKQCRYSQVRIIESSPARVIIHWRYAPVDVTYEHPFIDPETGWFDWVDEYYTIYPNATGVRKIIVHSGGLHKWIEFQEGIVINPPGTLPDENIKPGAVTIGNMEGQEMTYIWDENGGPIFDQNPALANILKINLKSERQPFAIVKPPKQYNNMITSYRGHQEGSKFNWWDHWPVSQDATDGRGAKSSRRPSHTSLCHIDLAIDPPVDCWGSDGYINVIRNGKLEFTLTNWGGLNFQLPKRMDLSQPFDLSFDYANLWQDDFSFVFFDNKGGTVEVGVDQLEDDLKLNRAEMSTFQERLDLSKFPDQCDLKNITEVYIEFQGNDQAKTITLDNFKVSNAGEALFQLDFEHPDGTMIEDINLPPKGNWEPYEEKENQITKLMLHGLTTQAVSQLVPLAENWLEPLKLQNLKSITTWSYDPTQLAYVIQPVEDAKRISFQTKVAKTKSMVTPAFVLKNVNDLPFDLVIDGSKVSAGQDFEFGWERRLEGIDLVIWVKKDLQGSKEFEVVF